MKSDEGQAMQYVPVVVAAYLKVVGPEPQDKFHVMRTVSAAGRDT